MDFEWNKQQQELRDRIAAVCDEHWSPQAAQRLEAKPEFPRQLYSALAAAGVVGHALPKPWGAGGTVLDMALINETLSRAAQPVSGPVFVSQVCGAALAFGGSTEQKDELLPQLAAGDITIAFALTEPQAGSDAAAIALHAQRVGDSYRLNGSKLYATGSWDADWILTAVRTDLDAKASAGTSLILVPRHADGLEITPLEKIGARAHASCELVYTDVTVNADRLIGTENGAWELLRITAALERICIAAGCIGTLDAAFADVRTFLSSREQFGRPIAEFQAVRHRVADLVTEAEALRWLTYRAAALADRGDPAAAGAVSMAKLFAVERCGDILLALMKLHGGTAYLDGHAAPRRLREAMLSFYAGGTAEIQRELIARQFFSAG